MDSKTSMCYHCSPMTRTKLHKSIFDSLNYSVYYFIEELDLLQYYYVLFKIASKLVNLQV